MSRYLIVTFTLLVSFVACAQKGEPLKLTHYKIINQKLPDQKTRLDAYALIAIDAYERKDFATASRFFEKLYDEEGQKEYLIEAIKSASAIRDYKRIKHLLDKAKGKFVDDNFINRYLVAYYLDKKEFQKAQKTVQKLLKNHPTVQDFELAALVYKITGNTQKAKHYYQKAYAIDHQSQPLLSLSEMLLNEGQKEEAIRLLESHIRIYGCDKITCSALIKIYTKFKELKPLAQIYQKLYEKTKEPLYAEALLDIYAYEQNFDDAISFLKKTDFSDEILLDIYTAKRDYKRAKRLAHKLYQKSKDPKYLAKEAVLEYESSKKKSKKLLKDVIKKFEKVVYKVDNPLYYNYYAYLLIDHDIDIKKGIKLVKKALEKEPDSLFYIDTLAWGYYKEGKCQQAYNLLKPYEGEKDQEEIVEHIQKIKQCLQQKGER